MPVTIDEHWPALGPINWISSFRSRVGSLGRFNTTDVWLFLIGNNTLEETLIGCMQNN